MSRSIAAQTSSSCSSDAEVAELAGGSIEDSVEMKRKAMEQQMMAAAGRATREGEVNGRSSDQRPSTEEEDNGEGR